MELDPPLRRSCVHALVVVPRTIRILHPTSTLWFVHRCCGLIRNIRFIARLIFGNIGLIACLVVRCLTARRIACWLIPYLSASLITRLNASLIAYSLILSNEIVRVLTECASFLREGRRGFGCSYGSICAGIEGICMSIRTTRCETDDRKNRNYQKT